MEAVKISSKFQVVIPREIREKLHLVPGQKLQAVAYENRIEFIPMKRLFDELSGLWYDRAPYHNPEVLNVYAT